MWLLSASLAHAQAAQSSQTFVPRPVAGHAVFDLRVGVPVQAGLDRPEICGTIRPTSWVVVEGCGSGHGTLHNAPGPDFSHYRAGVSLPLASSGRWQAQGEVLAGLAEVTNDADSPGFRTGEVDTGAVEAAGAEGALSLQGRHWFDPRLYLSVDLTGGAAVIPGAPEVRGTPGAVVPFVTLTGGVGF